jgi:hypothetical protein
MHGDILQAKQNNMDIFTNGYEYPLDILTSKPGHKINKNELFVSTKFGLFRISSIEFIKFYGTSIRFDTFVRI